MRFSNFNDVSRTRKGNFLNQVDHLIDWKPIEKAINRHYSPKSDVTGRPANQHDSKPALNFLDKAAPSGY